MKHLLLLVTILMAAHAYGQVTETKNWCQLTCEYTRNDSINADLLHFRMTNRTIESEVLSPEEKRIPLRIGIVQKDSNKASIPEIVIREAI